MKFSRKDILTIPNLLSLLRLLMIPLFTGLYLHDYKGWTAAVLILSGLTDMVDGYIARRFDQVSDFGKAFDPVADKLTQASMLLCLTTRYPAMLVPLILLVVKEIFSAIFSIIVIRRTGKVNGAEWHGKAVTMLLYGMMILHVLWEDIPSWASNTINIGCLAMMLLSLILYARRNWKTVRSTAKL